MPALSLTTLLFALIAQPAFAHGISDVDAGSLWSYDPWLLAPLYAVKRRFIQKKAISGQNAEKAATSSPVQIVATCGVLNRGCTRAKYCGKSPSRLIEKKIRGWPS